MRTDSFEAAAQAAAAVLGPSGARELASLLARGRGADHALTVLQSAAAGGPITELYRAADAQRLPYAEAAAYLRGYSDALRRSQADLDVRAVWSGPPTPGVPVRATAQVLAEVVRGARTELLAMTYTARPYAALTAALADAVGRGVEVHVVVETVEGARGLIRGPEPADAFAGVPGLRLWHWPPAARGSGPARQHAKLAVADRRVLFLGSANLTEAGARRNIEAGLLVRGGTAPERVAGHVRELQRRGVLEPLP